jgi:hypothetical protein
MRPFYRVSHAKKNVAPMEKAHSDEWADDRNDCFTVRVCGRYCREIGVAGDRGRGRPRHTFHFVPFG